MPAILMKGNDNLFAMLERYNLRMENFLASEFKKLHKLSQINWADLKEDLESDFNTDLFLDYSKKFREKGMFYQESYRYSFLVHIFSIFEYELSAVCLYLYKRDKTDFSFKDLSGSGDVEKATKYLKKVYKVDFNQLTPEWNFIENVRKIRNVIVHNRGEITRNHRHWPAIYQFIKSEKQTIRFSQDIQEMSKEEFKLLYRSEDIFNLEIDAYNFNNKLIGSIKQFFLKLSKTLDVEKNM